ncbi:MAG: hypothetical protein WCV55_01420 [Candidatus Paceibacterota bacterium]
MTNEEARIITKNWQAFIEVVDKLSKICAILPKSLLPYPIEDIEEALNIVAKEYFDAGDKKTSEVFKDSVGFLCGFKDDEEALESIHSIIGFMLENNDLKKIKIENLKKARDFWLKAKKENLQIEL